jgi:hypothetical protein
MLPAALFGTRPGDGTAAASSASARGGDMPNAQVSERTRLSPRSLQQRLTASLRHHDALETALREVEAIGSSAEVTGAQHAAAAMARVANGARAEADGIDELRSAYEERSRELGELVRAAKLGAQGFKAVRDAVGIDDDVDVDVDDYFF